VGCRVTKRNMAPQQHKASKPATTRPRIPPILEELYKSSVGEMAGLVDVDEGALLGVGLFSSEAAWVEVVVVVVFTSAAGMGVVVVVVVVVVEDVVFLAGLAVVAFGAAAVVATTASGVVVVVVVVVVAGFAGGGGFPVSWESSVSG